MIGGTCDYGTQGCEPIQYRVSRTATGYTIMIQPSLSTSTTGTLSSNDVWVSSTGPSRSRASRDVDLDLPEAPRPGRLRESRERVLAPLPVLLAPKQAARGTMVAWMRGRAPRDLSFRTLRLLGKGLRR